MDAPGSRWVAGTRLGRGDVGFGLYFLANAFWAVAATQNLGGVYAVADIACLGAAALLLAGWRRASPGFLASGAVGSIVCQVPFYALGLAEGGFALVGQVPFVVSFVAILVAARAWRRGELLTSKRALRAAGWLILLTGVAFLLANRGLASLWQGGNLLSAAAGIPLMITGVPPMRPGSEGFRAHRCELMPGERRARARRTTSAAMRDLVRYTPVHQSRRGSTSMDLGG